jgi:hypothetical protein
VPGAPVTDNTASGANKAQIPAAARSRLLTVINVFVFMEGYPGKQV